MKYSNDSMLTKSDITILMQQVDVTKAYDQPSAAAVDIRADYVAKNGNPNAAAPKIFFRYYYVNSSTGEKSGTMLAECKWTPGA